MAGFFQRYMAHRVLSLVEGGLSGCEAVLAQPDAAYLGSRLIQAATRSPIAIIVRFGGALTPRGIIDASATQSPANPRTRPCWSVTASGSSAAPIGTVPHG